MHRKIWTKLVILFVGLNVKFALGGGTEITPVTMETIHEGVCRIIPTQMSAVLSFQKLFKNKNVRLIRVHVNLNESMKGLLNGFKHTSTFLPLKWIKLKNNEAQGLLLLKEEMLLFPFSILSLGILDYYVNITESHINCFAETGMNITHFQNQLQTLILNDFSHSVESASDHLVCNQHIRGIDGTAEFYYICCYYDDKVLVCQELQEDFWIKMFFRTLFVLDILLVLYSPLFVPELLYREKYVNLIFNVHLKKHFTLKLLRLHKEEHGYSKDNLWITMKTLREEPDMIKFTKLVSEVPINSIQLIPVSTLLLKMKMNRLVSGNTIPVGLIETSFRSIVMCGIRDTTAVKDCCYSNLFGTFTKTKILWYKCLQKLMNVLFILFISLPWVLRVYLYYLYEDEIATKKFVAARDRHLRLQYPGSLVAYLTPVHILFLFLYGILVLGVTLFGVLHGKFKEQSRYLIRKCFRDMHSMNRTHALGYCIHILLIPFRKFGVFFLVVAWLYWLVALPELLLVFAFYFMPLVNIVCHLIFNYMNTIFPIYKCFSPIILAYQNIYKTVSSENETLDIFTEKDLGKPKKLKTRKEKMAAVLTSIILITMMVSFTVLALEFIIYFINFIFYQLIGLILYWNSLLKYVALLFIMILYARDCFNSVAKKYEVFYAKLLDLVKSRVSDEFNNIVSNSESEQKNTGIQDINEEVQRNVTLAKGKYSLQWRVPQLVLFVDRYDVCYLTRNFFFACAEIKNAGCPGNVMANYFRAFSQLLKIFLFLWFVILVIVAFGERYEVSGVNQTFLAAAGGILPWVFKNFLFKDPPEFDLDTDSPLFQNSIDETLRTHVEHACIFDIHSDGEITDNNDSTNIDLQVIDD